MALRRALRVGDPLAEERHRDRHAVAALDHVTFANELEGRGIRLGGLFRSGQSAQGGALVVGALAPQLVEEIRAVDDAVETSVSSLSAARRRPPRALRRRQSSSPTFWIRYGERQAGRSRRGAHRASIEGLLRTPYRASWPCTSPCTCRGTDGSSPWPPRDPPPWPSPPPRARGPSTRRTPAEDDRRRR